MDAIIHAMRASINKNLCDFNNEDKRAVQCGSPAVLRPLCAKSMIKIVFAFGAETVFNSTASDRDETTGAYPGLHDKLSNERW